LNVSGFPRTQIEIERKCHSRENGNPGPKRIWIPAFAGKTAILMDRRMNGFKDLIKKLLHIEDTPERTALAYAIGIFLGFSPFLGLHTLVGLAIAFLFGLNRVAILLGVWTNTPWWIVPFYMVATWVGMWVTGFWIDGATLKEIFQSWKDQGFMGSHFWGHVASQWGLLLSFGIGSLILCTLLSFVAYPLSLKWIRFYRSRKGR
jgi:uncharacterized protein (DUF2062 family)